MKQKSVAELMDELKSISFDSGVDLKDMFFHGFDDETIVITQANGASYTELAVINNINEDK